jgi:glycerol-3-phosphate dehydrogenase
MLKQIHKITVVGGGSWATANIKMLTDNAVEKEIFWWMRNEQAVEHISKFGHNPNYLSSVEIKVPAANISADLKPLIQACRLHPAERTGRLFKRSINRHYTRRPCREENSIGH